MKKTLLNLFIFFNLFICHQDLHAQHFYNYEDFFSDSSFILRHNIKVVNMRIPELLGDSAKAYAAYQRFCYNPYGKLAWYEYDSIVNNVRRKYYTWHLYDQSARINKSRIFQRCAERDSLREEIRYFFDPYNRLYHEDHYQIYISAYREWSFDYVFEGDSIKIRVDELDNQDTMRIDKLGRETEFTHEDWKYQAEFDDNGRRSKLRCFLVNNETTERTFVDEMVFAYDDKGRQTSIISSTRTIIYTFNVDGLPASSTVYDKLTGKKVGFEVFYDYEFRTDLSDSNYKSN